MQSSKTVYNYIVNELVSCYEENEARQLAKILVEDVFTIPFEKILVDEKINYSESLKENLIRKVEMLKNYNPIQYVLGKAHFHGRDFLVNPSVLIPRQETEELINEILIDNKKSGLKILDIGSGSGCIGITLGLELKNANISMLEIDEAALELARENARLQNTECEFILEDILTVDNLPDKYDIIVSNPPYITEQEQEQMLNNVLNHEPHKAMFVPDDHPLLFYKKIIKLAKNHLYPKGKLYFEINERFGQEMIRLCEEESCSYFKLQQDLNGKDRMLKARFD